MFMFMYGVCLWLENIDRYRIRTIFRQTHTDTEHIEICVIEQVKFVHGSTYLGQFLLLPKYLRTQSNKLPIDSTQKLSAIHAAIYAPII